MKCEKCKAEFTIKEQVKAKGCCPSCGVKLPASAYRDDAKAWRWYQYHSPMPFNKILAYIYLCGGGMLSWSIMSLSADLGLWSLTDPTCYQSVITFLLVFLLPFFGLFSLPTAKCANCGAEFTHWRLIWKKGRCPSCGEVVPVSDCSGVPNRRWWRLFRAAPLGLKLLAGSLLLLGCSAVCHLLLAVFVYFHWEVSKLPPLMELPYWMYHGRAGLIQGVASYIVLGVLFSHLLRMVVRGRIPYFYIAALVPIGSLVADSHLEFLVISGSLLIFMLAFLTPASRRWARKIREEDLACWIAARSGALPFRRMVAKCILKKIVIGALLLVCIGLWACGPESIERMCDWLKHRSEEVMSIH